jgi:hypothetical protein
VCEEVTAVNAWEAVSGTFKACDAVIAKEAVANPLNSSAIEDDVALSACEAVVALFAKLAVEI